MASAARSIKVVYLALAGAFVVASCSSDKGPPDDDGLNSAKPSAVSCSVKSSAQFTACAETSIAELGLTPDESLSLTHDCDSARTATGRREFETARIIVLSTCR